ncbi:MAG: helix-hairpin-helix domain-containing protein [Planctomycetaceae bacterium]
MMVEDGEPEPASLPAAPTVTGEAGAPEHASDQPEDVPPRKLWFDWSDRDQRVLLVLALLVFAGIGWHWLRWRSAGSDLVEIRRLPAREYDFKIDINRATWVEWMQLPGIGEVLARQIVADREQHGPFQQIADLKRVKGVGTVTFDTIQPWLTCTECKIGAAH